MGIISKQHQFALSLSRLIQWIDEKGYQVSGGEWWRPPEMAKLYASQGKGIATSLHCDRLAIDLNLFKDEVQLVTKEDYLPVGEFWKSLSIEGLEHKWGGDFKVVDANHFSISHNGRA